MGHLWAFSDRGVWRSKEKLKTEEGWVCVSGGVEAGLWGSCPACFREVCGKVYSVNRRRESPPPTTHDSDSDSCQGGLPAPSAPWLQALTAPCPSVVGLILLFLVTKEESLTVQVLRLLVIGEAVVVQLLIKFILLPLRHIILVFLVLFLLLLIQP